MSVFATFPSTPVGRELINHQLHEVAIAMTDIPDIDDEIEEDHDSDVTDAEEIPEVYEDEIPPEGR